MVGSDMSDTSKPSRCRWMTVITTALLLAALGCGSTTNDLGGTSGDDRSLAVPFEAQQTQVWCWAATTSMVLSESGVIVPQCQIVSETLWQDCCFLPQSSCVTTGPVAAMIAALDFHGGLQAYTAGRPLTLGEARAEIDAGRPFIIGYSGSFFGHVVVVFGYSEAGELLIHDPNYGTVRVPYDLTFLYSGSALWTDTILVRR